MSNAFERLEEELEYDRKLEAETDARGDEYGIVNLGACVDIYDRDRAYRQKHPLEPINHSENDNGATRKEAILHKIFEYINDAQCHRGSPDEVFSCLKKAKNLLRDIFDPRFWID